jgi:MFS family permease
VTCTISFIGAAIAPTANSIYRVIVAQILIGAGFAAVPLSYAIPSEIVPRRWRPVVLAIMNVAAQLGALTGSLGGGALTRASPHNGWRNLYWIQMALWGAAVIGIVIGYRPPKRHTRLDHLSFWEKLGRLDLPGMGLLSAGLSLLLTGLTLGDNPWEWTNVRVLTTLIIGIVLLIAFALYEWKGTSTGILHHELFARRTFPISIILMFIEGILLFSIVVFYPALTANLFETDPLKAAARTAPFWIGAALGTLLYGVWSSKRRTIRSPMLVGFFVFTCGLVGMATVQPNQSTNAIVFDGLAGFGYGSPLILIIVGVQLATPHHLIATATAVLTSARAVAASTFTAIYSAAVASQSKTKLPAAAARVAAAAGITDPQFIAAATSKDSAALSALSVAADTITAAIKAVTQAQADSYRIVFIIAVPFGIVACILTWFVDDMTTLMSYRVDAPVEELHGKHHKEGQA